MVGPGLWSGLNWTVAVTSGPISLRGKGAECRFGDNDLSCSLRITDGDYYVWHNNEYSQVSSYHRSGKEGVSSDAVAMSSGRVGVLLDSEARSLSFYHVSADEELSYLHTKTVNILRMNLNYFPTKAVLEMYFLLTKPVPVSE